MSGTTIAFDITTPTATDLVGQGDDAIRSLKSNLQGALDAEHLWPVAGGLSGVHRKGSARVFVGPSSQVSSADTDGRLMFNSTLSRLVYLDSASSTLVGGRLVPHGPSFGGEIGGNVSLVTQYVGIDANNQQLASGVTAMVTFNHTFVRAPIVTVTIIRRESTPGSKPYPVEVTDISASAFSVYWEGVVGGSASTISVAWQAVGRVALP